MTPPGSPPPPAPFRSRVATTPDCSTPAQATGTEPATAPLAPFLPNTLEIKEVHLMTHYEIGSRVVAEHLRTGDLFGEDRIEAITEHPAVGPVEKLTVTMIGGARLVADIEAEVVVPHRHRLEITITRLGGMRFRFACSGTSSACHLACTSCDRLPECCRCPSPRFRRVKCGLSARCNGHEPAALLLAYDGPPEPLPLRSGPVMLRPTPDGAGCLWRYPAPNPA